MTDLPHPEAVVLGKGGTFKVPEGEMFDGWQYWPEKALRWRAGIWDGGNTEATYAALRTSEVAILNGLSHVNETDFVNIPELSAPASGSLASDAKGGVERRVWVAISHVNGCAVTVSDDDHGHHVWPGATWTEFVDAKSFAAQHALIGRLYEALKKWDLAAKAADAANSEMDSAEFHQDRWDALAAEHTRLLEEADTAREEALAAAEPVVGRGR